jgi:hypothetical protein
MVPALDDVTIEFLGLATGGEILGATQADFVVDRPHAHAKEVSVLLNGPAAAFLAEYLGEEDTEEFRRRAAERVGAAWIRRAIERNHHVDSINFLSRARLESDPEFLSSLKG